MFGRYGVLSQEEEEDAKVFHEAIARHNETTTQKEGCMTLPTAATKSQQRSIYLTKHRTSTGI
jgi:hypothetical protein